MDIIVNETNKPADVELTEEGAIWILRQKNACFAAEGGTGNKESMVDVAAFLDFVEQLKTKRQR